MSRFLGTDDQLQRYIDNTINKKIAKNKLTPDDANLIKEFMLESAANRKIGMKRKMKSYIVLTNWREFLKPFRENTIMDIYNGLEALPKAQRGGHTRYKKNSVADYTRYIKRFYLWMIDNQYSTIPRDKIKRITPEGYDRMTKTAAMLLEESEVKTILEACQNSRDRALYSMLYEGGFRIGELANMRWEQIKFNTSNVAVNVDDKTGRPRYIPLYTTKPYLVKWKDDYPEELKADAYVFLNKNHQQLQYQGALKQLRILAARAGVTKKITFHIFRHSRITHLIQKGYSESVIKKMMWGNINTKMFETYAHLTNSDIEDEITTKLGLKEKKDSANDNAMEPRQCAVCHTINGPTQNFCGECGRALTGEIALNQKSAEDYLRSLPEYHAILDRIKDDMIKK
jgi:site-specific recombinase XerD